MIIDHRILPRALITPGPQGKFSEVDTIIKLIERNGDNNKFLYECLMKDQELKLPEVQYNPLAIVYKAGSNVNEIVVYAVPEDLNRHNWSKIIFVAEQLRKKEGIRTIEEIEMKSILQSFIATGAIPESIKYKMKKDKDQDGDGKGDGSSKSHRSDKDV